MREIARAAQVATGAAYYYFPSKDALVTQFYERAQVEMAPRLEAALGGARSIEDRMRAILRTKLEYFAQDRALLGALSGHADPKDPLSPFSAETAHIRTEDMRFFERAVKESKIALPRSVSPYLPRLLWSYQMGVLLFWVYDTSPGQQRTEVLLEKTLKMLAITLRIAQLPLLRPLHKLAGELLVAIYGPA